LPAARVYDLEREDDVVCARELECERIVLRLVIICGALCGRVQMRVFTWRCCSSEACAQSAGSVMGKGPEAPAF